MKNRTALISALLFTIVFPTILTYIYFIFLREHSPIVQRVVYTVGKSIQFGFPGVLVFLILKERARFKMPSLDDLLLGGLFGVSIFILGAMLYEYWLSSSRIIETLKPAIMQKLQELNVASASIFVAMGIFYCLVHSLMEEYYWRWFVFRKLRLFIGDNLSIVISSLAFMFHHVLILGVFFGFDSPLTYLLAFFIVIGGAVWAWLYKRSGSLYGIWLGHALIDALIFYIGYRVVF